MANPAIAQQTQGHAHQIRVFGIGVDVVRVVLETQRGGQFIRHAPMAHQPGAHLFAADAQQVLLDHAVANVRVDLKVAADQRKVRRKHVGQQQVAKVVQQPGQIRQPGFRAFVTRHAAGQAFNHRRRVDRLLPVRRAGLRVVLGQAQGFTQ